VDLGESRRVLVERWFPAGLNQVGVSMAALEALLHPESLPCGPESNFAFYCSGGSAAPAGHLSPGEAMQPRSLRGRGRLRHAL
jgi:hypothetical protein